MESIQFLLIHLVEQFIGLLINDEEMIVIAIAIFEII